jgi:hypothetical protein
MLTFWRALHWLIFKTRIYTTWSKVYRWLRHRKYRKHVSRIPIQNAAKAQASMDLITWRADTWRALWDAIGCPYRFAYFVREAIRAGATASQKFDPESDCDCDDFTAFGVETVLGSVFLQVARQEGRSFWGHFVCLFRAIPQAVGSMQGEPGIAYWWHIGNWGLHGPYTSVREAIGSVLQGRPMIGWAVLDNRLRLVACGQKRFPRDEEVPGGR